MHNPNVENVFFRLEDTILSTTDHTDHFLAGARIVELAKRVSSV